MHPKRYPNIGATHPKVSRTPGQWATVSIEIEICTQSFPNIGATRNRKENIGICIHIRTRAREQRVRAVYGSKRTARRSDRPFTGIKQGEHRNRGPPPPKHQRATTEIRQNRARNRSDSHPSRLERDLRLTSLRVTTRKCTFRLNFSPHRKTIAKCNGFAAKPGETANSTRCAPKRPESEPKRGHNREYSGPPNCRPNPAGKCLHA